MRKTDANSIAGIARAAYLPSDTARESESHQQTALLAFSGGWLGVEGCHPSCLCQDIDDGAGLIFSQSRLMVWPILPASPTAFMKEAVTVTWSRLSFHSSSSTVKAPAKTVFLGAVHPEAKKLKCS